jgi:mono/diheme cytochrome c family protein
LFTNLLIWLIFGALTLGGIWLVIRSLRSQSRSKKVLGVLGGALLTLLFGSIVFMGAKGMMVMYTPVAEATDLQVEITPERVARGEYLASISCLGCHGANGGTEYPLSGGLNLSDEIPVPIGLFIADNITPGGVIKERTDGELFRLLRYGYNGDNQVSAVMSNLPYREMSDEDLNSLIAYLRSLEPVEASGKRGSSLNFLAAVMTGSGLFPIPEPINRAVTAPARGETAEYGKYVATFGDCRVCHGPDMTGTEPSLTNPEGAPNPRPMVGTWALEEFIQAMRTGVRPSGLALEMPWKNASHMDDQDLAALYTYLRTEP